MDRLLREGNPPAGQLASPKPQYKKPGVDEYAPVEGQHGAPFATLKDASGNIVSPATEDKLEQVRQLLAGVATDAKLEQVKSELELVKSELQTIKTNQTSGDQKVQLSGTKATIETLLNAVSVPPGTNTGFVQIPTLGCKKIILMVNSDKTWRMTTNTPVGGVAGGGKNHIYPDVWTEVQDPAISSNYPREIIVGYGVEGAQSRLDALDKALLWQGVRIRVENVSSDVATFTVKVLRIWEV